MTRCAWAEGSEEMGTYHDTEWGFPVVDDRRLFEKVSLEGFQSGLSWRTILAKRPAFRKAFDDFDIHAIARYTEADVARLLGDAGIVRHRGKIEAVVNNAARAIELVEEAGSIAGFVWGYEPHPDTGSRPPFDRITNDWLLQATTSPESVALSKDLRRRGWRFVGPTTAYAFMQAMGLVNDHSPGCPQREEVEAARRALTRP